MAGVRLWHHFVEGSNDIPGKVVNHNNDNHNNNNNNNDNKSSTTLHTACTPPKGSPFTMDTIPKRDSRGGYSGAVVDREGG